MNAERDESTTLVEPHELFVADGEMVAGDGRCDPDSLSGVELERIWVSNHHGWLGFAVRFAAVALGLGLSSVEAIVSEAIVSIGVVLALVVAFVLVGLDWMVLLPAGLLLAATAAYRIWTAVRNLEIWELRLDFDDGQTVICEFPNRRSARQMRTRLDKALEGPDTERDSTN